MKQNAGEVSSLVLIDWVIVVQASVLKIDLKRSVTIASPTSPLDSSEPSSSSSGLDLDF